MKWNFLGIALLSLSVLGGCRAGYLPIGTSMEQSGGHGLLRGADSQQADPYISLAKPTEQKRSSVGIARQNAIQNATPTIVKSPVRAVNYQEKDSAEPARTARVPFEFESPVRFSSKPKTNLSPNRLVSAYSSESAELQEPADDDVPVNVYAADGSLSLEQLEQMALDVNPAVLKSAAEIQSLRGKLLQAGLPPNPTVGINGGDINEDGGAGRYGVYFGREVVRGNKLGLSRSVVCAEIQAAEHRLEMMRLQIANDVRLRYYDVLVSQEKTVVADDLVQISKNAVDISTKLLEAKEATKSAVLQSELELQNALVVKRQAQNERLAARRKLAALIGQATLPAAEVAGDARVILKLEAFEETFDDLINRSPEIEALLADVESARRQVARECAQPIGNLTWQTTLQYDTVADDVVAGFQIGMPVPTLNRNQGAIRQAQNNVIVAERSAEKKVLEMRARLASAYETYLDAKVQIDAYDSEILPRAKETYDLISEGYAQGESGYLQLLTTQRTYSQINLAYLAKLREMWRQSVKIRGMLLSGSID